MDEPDAYRAIVVLTDGLISGVSAPGPLRTVATGTGDTSGEAVPPALSWTYDDASHPAPWQATAGIALREYRRDTALSITEGQADTVALAAWLDEHEHTSVWFVSFRDTAPYMDETAVGDGEHAYVPTADVALLPATLAAVAEDLRAAAAR